MSRARLRFLRSLPRQVCWHQEAVFADRCATNGRQPQLSCARCARFLQLCHFGTGPAVDISRTNDIGTSTIDGRPQATIPAVRTWALKYAFSLMSLPMPTQ